MSLDYRREHDLLAEVYREREQQDAKFGQQNHPDGTGFPSYKNEAANFRNWCDQAFEYGNGTWADIFLEEVYEALAEDDPARLREELIQVAAVAMGWVGAIDRRKK